MYGTHAADAAAVVNFPPRRIGPFVSDVVAPGMADAADKVVLGGPSIAVPNGGRLF